MALGNFDGVHLAHQKMFQRTLQLARKVKGTAVAYTFDPHPVRILSQESAPPMLNTLPQRLELIKKTGMQAVIVEPFDLKFAHWTAEEWFKKILVENLHAFAVIAGYDFTFGTHRSGTVETLEKLAAQHGLNYRILEAQMRGETLISSTQIRQFLLRGDVERAADLLGRPYFIDGIVVRGAGRGAKLGFPTANLRLENELPPLSGIYAGWAEVGGRRFKAVTNIGTNPTFGGKSMSVETYLLRFKKDIYGKKLRFHFVKRIREERTFASVEALVKQIRDDIDKSKNFL